jgi:YD repeat-containing protein
LDDLIAVAQGSQTRTFVYDSLKRLASATNPESGTVSYTYDAAGNLKTRTDARSLATSYTYDALNRTLTASYPSGTPNVTYTYDGSGVTNGLGHLTSISAANGVTTKYTAFDTVGHITANTQITADNSYSFGYSYNLAG